MKKHSKILVLLLSLALIIGAVAVVSAASDEASEEYTFDLAGAITSADPEAAEITLTGNALISETVHVTKNLTINLGGYKLASELAETFVVNEGFSLRIEGEGQIEVAGLLVKSTTESDDVDVSIVGDSKNSIDIFHKATADGHLYSVKKGSHTLKNLKITSLVKGTKAYESLIEGVYNTGSSVDMTIDSCYINAMSIKLNRFFVIGVGGVGSHLTINDSVVNSSMTGVFIGHIKAVDSTGAESKNAEAASINNSIISCVAPVQNETTWALFLEGYEWAKAGTVGTVNIKDSVIECAGRALYGSYEKAPNKEPTSLIIVDNSTIRSIGTNGTAHGEFSFRYVDAELINGSRVGTIKGQINQNSAGKVSVSVGTRVNLYSATVYSQTDYSCFILPDGSHGVSENYTWIYDPMGDHDYPYMLAEITSDGYVIGKGVDEYGDPCDIYYEGVLPTYRLNFGFDAIYTTPNGTDAAYNNLVISDYGRDTHGSVDMKFSDGENFKQMQIACKRGSIYRANATDSNSYFKYVVTPYSGNPTAETRSFISESSDNADPFFVFGAPDSMNANLAKTAGDARVAVAVLDYDFGTDSPLGYYPEIKISTQTRTNGAGSSSNDDGRFYITANGTVKNELKDAKSVTLNPAGEWNHLSVVMYTDPTTTYGVAYYYLNGEYMGWDPICSSNANLLNVQTYLMGTRVDINSSANHYVGASFAFDNISFRAYKDYVYGESDGNVSKDTAVKYINSAPTAGKLINPAYAIGGKPTDLDVNESLKAAAGGTVDVLVDTIGNPLVKENGTIAANGHKFVVDTDSYGADIAYDATGNITYTFDETYNQTVKYNFYVGYDYEDHSDALYDTIEYKIGQNPAYDYIHSLIEINGRTGVLRAQNGWDSKYLAPISAAMIKEIVEAGGEVYVYPTFADSSVALTAYVKNADGIAIKGATNNDEATKLYAGLKDGETCVLLSNVALKTTTYFYNDAPTVTDGKVDRVFKNADGAEVTVQVDKKVVNGVVIDNDYTAEEIEKMKEVAQVVSLDLNGYKLTLTEALGAIAAVSNNTIYNCYSSVPGAEIYSRNIATKNDTAKTKYLSSQRMFAVMSRDYVEGFAKSIGIFNAHLNIGTYTDPLSGVTYDGSNMFINGSVLFEGNSGDNSCSLNAEGFIAVRGFADSGGAVMTRYYDGEMSFKDMMFINPTSTNIVDMKQYTNTANISGTAVAIDVTPFVTFEDCVLINKGGIGDVTGQNGDIDNTRCLTFINCTANGRLNPSNANKSYYGYGSAAAYLPYNGKYVGDKALAHAYYNVGMTMEGFLDEGTHFIKVRSPYYIAESNTIVDDNYYYIVDYGYYDAFVAENPDVDANKIVALPLLTEKLVYAEETATVTYVDLDGNVTKYTESDMELNDSYTYVIGGNIVHQRLSGNRKAVSAIVSSGNAATGALAITVNGGWVCDSTVVSGDVTLTPAYDVAANISGVKANLSIYAEFGINIYIPIAYAEYITSAKAGNDALVMNEVDLDGDGAADYLKVTVNRAAKDAKVDASVALGISDTYNGVTYTPDVSVSLNVVSYASKVLALDDATDADKALMYQMLTYANEAIKYAGGEADAEIAALIGENTVTDYTELGMSSYDTAALSAVFAGATVDTDADLAYVLALKEGFVGTVTVKNGDATYTFEVDENDTEIRISGMKVYNFAHDLVINAEGTIDGEAVSVADGRYNLATFTKYHVANAQSSEESAKCVAFAKAFYNYVMEAAAYVAE